MEIGEWIFIARVRTTKRINFVRFSTYVRSIVERYNQVPSTVPHRNHLSFDVRFIILIVVFDVRHPPATFGRQSRGQLFRVVKR